MRFIGNKKHLLNSIYYTLKRRNIRGNSFFDFFSGTTNVARFFKKKNYKIFSSDLLYFSYCMQYAYIKNNKNPQFKKLLAHINIEQAKLFYSASDIVVEFLNHIEPIEGFIYNNYSVGGTSHLKKPRMYFSDDNAKKIDAIRTQIEEWKSQCLLSNEEYFILLTCLIESVSFYSNISGVYAAFQKKWDKRALKPFKLQTIELVFNKEKNEVFNMDSIQLVHKIDADILYLDPPYNERQYAPNYHILETIARYDNPMIKGITGMRDYSNQKSSFCNKNNALQTLNNIAKNAKYKHIILSYNSEGIMSSKNIMDTLQSYGTVELVEFKYLRFKSSSNGENKTKKHIQEQLYILRK
ncbi:DNA adenine methylase [Candidatus Endomicrobiellum agilis]|uniref:DNA adenine methylase n=1 Tax=Candidatus Endomicrobiellum agilis TaxID=3238957 RepID=UPI00357EE2C9|nr:DNA adenine methylase [Endomicrobium sp.]